MEIIITHEQADFDAAGSVLAAWLLDPSRMPILPKKRNRNLAAFIEDYKTRLPFFTWKTLPKGPIQRIYITDTQNIAMHERMEKVRDIIVWDHHPHRHIFPDRDENIYDMTGACTTFLVEQLMQRPEIHPGRIFSTLMLMGIYEDTGSLSYGTTTPRDIRASAWLVEQGGDLDLMRRYVLQPMTDHQQQGCELLMQNLESYEILGKQICIAAADIREISDEFSAVAHHLRDMLNPDGLILLLAVKTGVRMICRSTTDDIDFGAMMRAMNGGGHARAASGSIPVEYMETGNAEEILSDARESVLKALPAYIKTPLPNLAEKMKRSMSPAQLDLIRRTAEIAEKLSMPVYIVGGVVRDLLQDHPVMDFDIVAEGDAIRLGREIAERFGGKLTTHPHFFTAKWELSDGTSLDLISARSECYDHPGALPKVEMSDMHADLKRRDFTINTLAIRLDGEHYGELLDLCGGMEDLRGHLIRTLHERSFIDDPTRIFRAIRFEQRFDFDLEPETLKQLREQLSGIAALTGQRITHELRLYCAEPYPENDFSRICELGIAAQIHSCLRWDDLMEEEQVCFRNAKRESFWDEMPQSERNTADEEGPLWIWLSSFPQRTVSELGERLVLPGKVLHIIEGLRRLRDDFPRVSLGSPSEITFFLEKEAIESLYCYWMICPESEQKQLKKFILNWRHVHPHSTGGDLIKIGIEPGPQIRKLLTELRAACLDLDLQPEEEAEWLDHFI